MGNRNGNGEKLGQATKQHYTQVDHLAMLFRGNKNKNGKKLGLDSTECFRADKDPQQKIQNNVLSQKQSRSMNVDTQAHTVAHSPQKHADILFKGNTNGNGHKLGSMDIEDGVQDTAPVSLQLDAMEACHIMADKSNVSNQKNKNIPETVKLEKIYSTDHNRCMYQNKTRFGFSTV